MLSSVSKDDCFQFSVSIKSGDNDYKIPEF